MSQLELVMIVIKIDGVLATRPRVIYLGRRPHRAALISLIGSIKTLFRDRSVTLSFIKNLNIIEFKILNNKSDINKKSDINEKSNINEILLARSI